MEFHSEKFATCQDPGIVRSVPVGFRPQFTTHLSPESIVRDIQAM